MAVHWLLPPSPEWRFSCSSAHDSHLDVRPGPTDSDPEGWTSQARGPGGHLASKVGLVPVGGGALAGYRGLGGGGTRAQAPEPAGSRGGALGTDTPPQGWLRWEVRPPSVSSGEAQRLGKGGSREGVVLATFTVQEPRSSVAAVFYSPGEQD